MFIKRYIPFLLLPFFLACNDDDDPEIPNEEELITTVNVTLSPVDKEGDEVLFSFSDPDGDGGDDPSFSTETLQANTVYEASIEVLNESESPAEDVTEEIMREDDEHQFFFQTSGGLELTVAYDDEDDDGNPIGLATRVTTGNPSQGQWTITLRHEPEKDAEGVADGNIENAGGETDIEVTFDVEIQ